MKKFKTFKALLSAFLALVVLISAIPSVFAAEKELTSIKREYFGSAKSSAITLGLRNYLTEQISNGVASIDVRDYNINVTDFKAICDEIFYEIPESFAVNTIGGSSMGNKLAYIMPTYTNTPKEIKAMLGECQSVADKMVGDIKNSTLSDEEKALLIHDRLALHTEYDYQRYLDDTIPKISYNMYGILAKKIGVCQGYAQAYTYLLKQVGIEADYCSSETLNHGWNIVYIDGNAYYVDVTWDDPVWDTTGRVNHTYFLKSKDAFMHTAGDYTLIPNNTKYDSYYWDNSNSAFQYIKGELYYIDHSEEKLKKASTNEVLSSVSARWTTGEYSYWPGSFSRLSSDGDNLLFSLNDGIYHYDLKSKSTQRIYTSDFKDYGEYYSVYGFTLEDDYLVMDVYDSPNFKNKAETELRVKYEKPEPKAGDINGDGKINLSDVSLLAQNVAGWQGLKLVKNALDVNGDGKETLSDVSHLAQYVAGWQGTKLYIKKSN